MTFILVSASIPVVIPVVLPASCFRKQNRWKNPISQTQHAPDAVADRLFVLITTLAPHLGGLDIGGALVVGLGQHAHDGDEDLFDGLDGGPAFGGVLVVVGVVAWGVQDGDADEAARVDWRVDSSVSFFHIPQGCFLLTFFFFPFASFGGKVSV